MFNPVSRTERGAAGCTESILVSKLPKPAKTAVFEGDGSWRDDEKGQGYIFAGAEYVPDGPIHDTRAWQLLNWEQFSGPEVRRAMAILRTPPKYVLAP